MSENGRGKGTGMVNAQTVVSMRCAANQRNVVRQSNYALKAINGAGNDIIVFFFIYSSIREILCIYFQLFLVSKGPGWCMRIL